MAPFFVGVRGLLRVGAAVKLQELSEQGLINGDVDGVPKVTSADAACILRWTVKIITVFPIEEMQP